MRKNVYRAVCQIIPNVDITSAYQLMELCTKQIINSQMRRGTAAKVQ